ncbi:uroporphyrinogen decarboxylase [Algihabitans albus]|uniref:uroporphyrinogen decarboxylase n=1 Tax=Algihabitans albus TaxID=2164067 RepID=UPI001F15FAED|nr:uroporphyrinogen decarboxylase [Algihabitans albus]
MSQSSRTDAESAKPRKLLLRALAGERLPVPPIWLMRQAGRYLPEYRETRKDAGGFLNLCFTPELATEVTLQPIRRFGFDAAILFSDILVVPHALGQKVWFQEGEGPKLEALADSRDLTRLSPTALHDKLEPVYETVDRLSSALPDETTLIGFAGAPWTVASYMIEGGSSKDFQKAKTWAYGDPEGFQTLIDLLVDATSRYLIRQVQAGAEVLQIFDSWSGVWPEPQFRRWCLAPMAEIVRRVKSEHPKVPVILFPRGAGLLYADVAAEAGADAVSLDTTVPLAWAADHLQSQVTLQGNLDPILLVAGGETFESSVESILDRLSGGPFVFNLGHGIVPQTPPEHVAKLLDIVRSRPS